MTREEKQKVKNALRISAPVMAVTQEEFNDYIQTLNKVMDWLEQEPCEDAVSRQEVLYLIADNDLSMGQVVRGIHALPSVNPQEPVIDKIRAEIEQLPTKTRTNWDGCCPDIDYPEIEYVDVTKAKLLKIIDKYKTDKETKDGDDGV